MRARVKLDPHLRDLIALALKEDLGRRGDLSTRWFVPRTVRLRGSIVAKQPGVLCGLRVAEAVFRRAAPGCRFRSLARDGQSVRPGQAVAEIRGPREVLTAERTALNFLQRMSGVATLTRAYAQRLRGTGTRLLDTRKTLPGWRALDKYAVRCGGGANHRMGLYDMVMLKDNHLEELASGAEARVREAVRRFRRSHPEVPVLMEAKTRREVDLALACGADIVLLDNMPPARLRREVLRIRRVEPGGRPPPPRLRICGSGGGRRSARNAAGGARPLIEVSGGVGLDDIRSIARLGVDRISVGRLTHSAPALDLSLELSHE